MKSAGLLMHCLPFLPSQSSSVLIVSLLFYSQVDMESITVWSLVLRSAGIHRGSFICSFLLDLFSWY